MQFWIRFFWQSAYSRRLALFMVILSIGLSTALLMTVQQIRIDARKSFSQAVSGVDLIVGPKGSATDLLLYSLFQIGRPTANIDAHVLRDVQSIPMVSWVVPLQLGDSYKGFPVWGTSPAIFQRLKTQGRTLEFSRGRSFEDPNRAADPSAAVYELVLGAEVAKRFGHGLGDRIVVTHGSGSELDQDHTDQPFTVVGILSPTGAPIDRAVLISVQGFEALHKGWGVGAFSGFRPGFGLGKKTTPSASRSDVYPPSAASDLQDLAPRSFTALLIGLESRIQIFFVKQAIESLTGHSLMAVMPGVTLDELWQSLSIVENTLALMIIVVALISLLSIAAVLVVSFSGRRKELAVLRALGMSPRRLMGLALIESSLLGLLGILVGLAMYALILFASADWLRLTFGLSVELGLLSWSSWAMILGLFLSAVIVGFFPGVRAYRLSLSDGLNPPHMG